MKCTMSSKKRWNKCYTQGSSLTATLDQICQHLAMVAMTMSYFLLLFTFCTCFWMSFSCDEPCKHKYGPAEPREGQSLDRLRVLVVCGGIRQSERAVAQGTDGGANLGGTARDCEHAHTYFQSHGAIATMQSSSSEQTEGMNDWEAGDMTDLARAKYMAMVNWVKHCGNNCLLYFSGHADSKGSLVLGQDYFFTWVDLERALLQNQGPPRLFTLMLDTCFAARWIEFAEAAWNDELSPFWTDQMRHFKLKIYASSSPEEASKDLGTRTRTRLGGGLFTQRKLVQFCSESPSTRQLPNSTCSEHDSYGTVILATQNVSDFLPCLDSKEVARDFRGDSFVILSPLQCPLSASWFFLGSQNETQVYANATKIPSKTLAGQYLIGGSPGQIARNASWEDLSIDEDLWNSVLDERNVTTQAWRVNLDASQVQVGKPLETEFEGIHAATKLRLRYRLQFWPNDVSTTNKQKKKAKLLFAVTDFCNATRSVHMQVEIQIGLQKRFFTNTFSKKQKCQYSLTDLEMSDHYREVRVRTRIVRIDKHIDIQRRKLKSPFADLPPDFLFRLNHGIPWNLKWCVLQVLGNMFVVVGWSYYLFRFSCQAWWRTVRSRVWATTLLKFKTDQVACANLLAVSINITLPW